ncbi:hypothetical protein LPW11_03950 [Geomonas sp. RF6]|uniref:hypothetical protein n=1 Tax=Geomonas sp. RF6 TaxID=2897342 RepID=UPI001E288A5C|nr:hypothetical protein [Geomonas sp. RF6]UFS71351.1 hypothetical protein LPW11_03950 [Geomonas sp. RF6]
MQLRSLATLAISATLLLSGCGGGGTTTTAVSKEALSRECIRCHEDAVSPGTKVSLISEWQGSSHALANGAGCADCHEPAIGHPNVCSTCHGGGGSPTGYEVTRNPDTDGKCLKCHGVSHSEDVLMKNAPQHFGSVSGTGVVGASYVNVANQGKCRSCHNPHQNTLTPQHRAFALSGHGKTDAEAFNHYDFKSRTDGCNRCHTSTGFKKYVTDFATPTPAFGVGDTTRGVLGCDTCHESYNYKSSLRQLAAVSAPYKGVAAARFPDVGESNLCLPCHAGLESGATINALADGAFGNAGFENSHYLAAAGLMYMKIGFTNFTSASAPFGSSTYGQSLSPDSDSTPGGMLKATTSAHRNLGTPLINGDRHNLSFFVPGVLDKNGPCVTCHLNGSGVAKREASGHSMKIDANAYRQVCINCHTSENTVPLAADGSDFARIFLEPQAEAYEEALRLMEHLLLTKYEISFNKAVYPYFYDEKILPVNGKKQAVRDWTRGGTVNGKKMMGACFNFNLLKREPAAYAHARSYSRRLIYDSIDFLDDGIMNGSTGATALASGLTMGDHVTPVYVKDDSAYNTAGGTISTIYGNTSEAMLYLIGWSRSTGKWNAVERP